MRSAQSGEVSSSSRRSASKPSQTCCAFSGAAVSGAPVVRGPWITAIAQTIFAISRLPARGRRRLLLHRGDYLAEVPALLVGEAQQQVSVRPESVQRGQVAARQRPRLLGRELVLREHGFR